MWVIKAGLAAPIAALGLVVAPGLATAEPSPAPAPPTPKTTIDADGTYAVGSDLVPGVYSSAGPVGDGVCSWRRIGNPDGATIDNALTHKPQVVLIDPTDKAFKTAGCQAWQLTEDATPDAAATSPVLAGLQLRAFLAQLNSRAAASGQLPPP